MADGKRAPAKSGSDATVGVLILCGFAGALGYGWWKSGGDVKASAWWSESGAPVVDQVVAMIPFMAAGVVLVLVVFLLARWRWARRVDARNATLRAAAPAVESMRVGSGKSVRRAVMVLRGRAAKRRLVVTWPDGWDASDAARRKVERALAEVAGRPVEVAWGRRRLSVPWADGPAALERADDHRVERIERIMADNLPGCTGVRVQGDPGAPAAVVCTYTHGRATRARVAQTRIDEAVGAALGGGPWVGEWAPEDDRVTFRPAPPVEAFPLVAAIPFPEVTDLSSLEVGVREDGSPWLLSLEGGRHTFVVGATGSGKGSILQSILRQLAPGISAGLVRVIFVDPKGGAEGLPVRALCERVMVGDGTNSEEIAVFLEGLCREMNADAGRLAKAGKRKHVPTVEHPFTVVIIDEIASLTKYLGSKQVQSRILNSVGALTTMGRSAGWCLIAAVQDPRKEVTDVRDLFAVRIGLRLNAARDADMALGEGARGRGAACDEVAKDEQGVGFVLTDVDPDPVKVRAGWVSDDDIAEMVGRFAWPGEPVVIGASWLEESKPVAGTVKRVPRQRGSVKAGSVSALDEAAAAATFSSVRPQVAVEVRAEHLAGGERLELDVGNGDVRPVTVEGVVDEGDGFVAVSWVDAVGERGVVSCPADELLSVVS